MNLLHFILLVLLGLLGLLAPSAGAVPHQMTDVTADNTLRDLGHTVRKNLAARQGYPSDLLVRWGLKCAVDREKTDFAPEAPGSFLTPGYCKTYVECKSDGTKVKKSGPEDWDPFHKHSALKTANKEWQVNDLNILPCEAGANELNYRCHKWCECDIVDEPKLHYAENFGCPNPVGEQIHGNFGSVSRDTGSDALVMEAYDGPPRKE